MAELREEVIRAKWAFDGAKTLEEAAQRLEEYAASLRQMAAEGWELTGEIYDDYGIVVRGKSDFLHDPYAGHGPKRYAGMDEEGK